MARDYSGMLGMLAFLVVVGRGVLHRDELPATMQSACVALVGAALVGAVVGSIANRTVTQSVHQAFHGRLLAVLHDTTGNAANSDTAELRT